MDIQYGFEENPLKSVLFYDKRILAYINSLSI